VYVNVYHNLQIHDNNKSNLLRLIFHDARHRLATQMLIGDVSRMEMAPVLRRLEKTVDRQINPTIFTHDDFVKNLARKNHFLLTVMRERKLW